MTTLLLIRHAKAEAPSAELSDHERALTLAGRTAATQLGDALRSAGHAPDAAIVSTAVRAQQTWQLMSAELGDVEVRHEPAVYETDDTGLQALIAQTPASAHTLVVVGHEPTISATAAVLAGQDSDTPSLKRIAHGLPTGTAAVLEYDGAWADITARSMRLTGILSADIQY